MSLPLLLLVYPLAFASVMGAVYATLRSFEPRLRELMKREEDRLAESLRDLFYEGVSGRTLVRLQLAGAPVAALFVLLGTGSAVFGLVAGALVFLIPRVVLRLAARHRRERLEAQVLDVISSLIATTKSGMSLLQSVEEVARRMPPPIAQEFSMVLERVRTGQPLEAALAACDRRLDIPNLSLVVQSVRVNEERGGRLPELLEKIAKSLREISRVEERVKTETAGIRLSSKLMAAMPLVIGFLLYLASPEHILMLFNTLLGNLILLAVAVLDYLGFAIIRKLGELEV
jgi:tight adherence protein B